MIVTTPMMRSIPLPMSCVICKTMIVMVSLMRIPLIPDTFYLDADSDGFGDASFTTVACTQPIGYVANDLTAMMQPRLFLQMHQRYAIKRTIIAMG